MSIVRRTDALPVASYAGGFVRRVVWPLRKDVRGGHDAFTAAGLRILVISEPAAAPDTPRELLPDAFADNRRFLFFVLQTESGATAADGGNWKG
jgi:hypothetical protein